MSVTVIEVDWEGPYLLSESRERNGKDDYGLYQWYGQHVVYGNDALLYIGQAGNQTFGRRLLQHNWELWTASPVSVYLGKLYFNPENLPESWPDGGQVNYQSILDRTEKLLIFSHSPSFNSSNLNKICTPPLGSVDDDFRVFNWGMRKALMAEVSLFRWESTRTIGHKIPNVLDPLKSQS